MWLYLLITQKKEMVYFCSNNVVVMLFQQAVIVRLCLQVCHYLSNFFCRCPAGAMMISFNFVVALYFTKALCISPRQTNLLGANCIFEVQLIYSKEICLNSTSGNSLDALVTIFSIQANPFDPKGLAVGMSNLCNCNGCNLTNCHVCVPHGDG